MSQKIVDRRKRPAAPSLVEWVGGSLTTLDGQSSALWLYRGRPVAQRTLGDVTVAEALRSLIEGAEAARRPTKLRVDAAVAAALGAEVAGVPVTAGEVAEVERLQAMFADDHVGVAPMEPSLTHHGAVPVGVLAGLFESAARMQMIAPWRHLSEDELVRVRCPALGLDLVASVFDLTEDEEGTRGVACFASVEQFKAFRVEVTEAGEEARENAPPFVINLLAPRLLAPSLVREIAQHGLPVVEGRAPFVAARMLEEGPGLASPRHMLQAWAISEAVSWMAGREADGKTLRFDALLERDASVAFVAPMIPGLPRVEVEPVSPELLDDDDRAPTEAEAHAEEVWLWAEGYFDEQVEKGRERASLRAFNALVDLLCNRLEDSGERLEDWDAEDVAGLWDAVADEIPVKAEELLPGVDDLVAWLRWTESTGRFAMGEVLAETVLAAKDDFTPALAREREDGEWRSLDAYYETVFGEDDEG